jgi:hypothetical protein
LSINCAVVGHCTKLKKKNALIHFDVVMDVGFRTMIGRKMSYSVVDIQLYRTFLLLLFFCFSSLQISCLSLQRLARCDPFRKYDFANYISTDFLSKLFIEF